MAKEILLYGRISDYSAVDFITALDEAKGTDITVRMNTMGGDVEAGYGMVAKLAEHKKGKTVKVDGKANSMGLYALCYVEDAECLDVSTATLHRAGTWLEQYPDMMTDAMWDSLNKMNANLRKALEAKIDVLKFTQLKGVTLDQVFSNDGRIEVELNAEEMKAIGLVKRINKITPELRKNINAIVVQMAGKEAGIELRIAAESGIESEKPKNNNMTLQELKAAHPAICAQIVAEGIAQERDRAGAWMAFVDVDPEAVAKGIKEGSVLSATAMAELSRKSFSKGTLSDLEKNSAKPLTTAEAEEKEKTEKEKNLAAFEAEAKKHIIS